MPGDQRNYQIEGGGCYGGGGGQYGHSCGWNK